MKFFVYILYSEKLDKFYIGYSAKPEERLLYHNDPVGNSIWTKRGIPWAKFLIIPCSSEKQAVNIERHVKKMKSKKYILDLLNYPELVHKLQLKYTSSVG